MKKSTIFLITILIISFIILNAFPILLLNSFKQHKDVVYLNSESFDDNTKEVSLITEDNLELKSWQVDADNPKGMVIFLSGLNNDSITSYFGHALMMKENGYSSLLLEMRAHGKSEGNLTTLGFDEVLDVKIATQYIKNLETYKDLPLILFGTSMGGATAINSIGKIDDIDAIISLSSFSSIEDAFKDILIKNNLPNFLIDIEKNLFKFYLELNFGKETIKNSPIYNISNLNNKPILFMHSEKDSLIPFNSLKRLVSEADKYSDNVSTYIVEGDNHLIIEKDKFNHPEMDEDYFNSIFNFLQSNFNDK